MSSFLPLTLFVLLFGQGLELGTSNPSVTVVSFKWASIHQTYKKEDVPSTSPPAEMTAANKAAARTQRINNPQMLDPNEMTMDGRSAAMEKAVQEARSTKPAAPDRYQYLARIHNSGKQAIEIVFWEYQFINSAGNSAVTKRQFLCGVKIKPDRETELQAFSLLGPTEVVDASSGNKSRNALDEKVIINRVEFADGTIWQRRDWNFAEVRDGIKRALDHPWEGEMCRAL